MLVPDESPDLAVTLLLAVQLAAAGLLFPATTMPPFLQHVRAGFR